MTEWIVSFLYLYWPSNKVIWRSQWQLWNEVIRVVKFPQKFILISPESLPSFLPVHFSGFVICSIRQSSSYFQFYVLLLNRSKLLLLIIVIAAVKCYHTMVACIVQAVCACSHWVLRVCTKIAHEPLSENARSKVQNGPQLHPEWPTD